LQHSRHWSGPSFGLWYFTKLIVPSSDIEIRSDGSFTPSKRILVRYASQAGEQSREFEGEVTDRVWSEWKLDPPMYVDT
jgi:hypothetical protein